MQSLRRASHSTPHASSSTAHTSTSITPGEQVASIRTTPAPVDDGAFDKGDSEGDGSNTTTSKASSANPSRQGSWNDLGMSYQPHDPTWTPTLMHQRVLSYQLKGTSRSRDHYPPGSWPRPRYHQRLGHRGAIGRLTVV